MESTLQILYEHIEEQAKYTHVCIKHKSISKNRVISHISK